AGADHRTLEPRRLLFEAVDHLDYPGDGPDGSFTRLGGLLGPGDDLSVEVGQHPKDVLAGNLDADGNTYIIPPPDEHPLSPTSRSGLPCLADQPQLQQA